MILSPLCTVSFETVAKMARSLTAIPRDFADPAHSTVCKAVFEELCVNANGDIVCSSCDVNGQRVYGNVYRDRIADVFNGPAYREMRQWLLSSRPDSWCSAIGHHCPRRDTDVSAETAIDQCDVRILKLEPTSHCNLQCPTCPVELQFKSDQDLKANRGRKVLPLSVMLDVVAQLPKLEYIFYFNFGEPFLHKDTIEFLREVRRTRPDVRIVTNTNGLVMTPRLISALAGEALMNRVVFSIDGTNQEAYSQYRVGGRFGKAFQKLAALAEECRRWGTLRPNGPPGADGVQVVWQYILFEWNDSDADIAKARQLAEAIDVSIEWVITSGYGASKRFLAGSVETAKLMESERSLAHPASPAVLSDSLAQSGRDALPFSAYCRFDIDCELLEVPYTCAAGPGDRQQPRYRATFQKWAGSPSHVPCDSNIQLRLRIKNSTGVIWDASRRDKLRLGLQFLSDKSRTELPSFDIIPSLQPQTHEILVRTPSTPGAYRLLVDAVHEHVAWFSERGSAPLEIEFSVV